MVEYNSEKNSGIKYPKSRNRVPVLESIDIDGVFGDLQFIDDYPIDEAIVAVHGFNPDPEAHPEARPPQEVWNDRFLKASEVACKLEEKNSLKRILISGGGNFEDNKSEAEIMYDWARDRRHPIMVFRDYIEKEEDSRNTRENVQKIYERAYEEEINNIIAISNFDHIERVHDEFEDVRTSLGESFEGEEPRYLLEAQPANVFPVPSDESYRKTDFLDSKGFSLSENIEYNIEEIHSKAA